MHSSFNLIKSNSANINGGKEIITDYINEVQEDVSKNILNSYEVIGKKILDKARSDAEIITMEAMKRARDIEKESYTQGYEQGLANGYEDGNQKGYQEAKQKGEIEVNNLINKANEILAKAEQDYENYLNIKKDEIINLSLEMAKMIVAKEFQIDESILDEDDKYKAKVYKDFLEKFIDSRQEIDKEIAEEENADDETNDNKFSAADF